MSHAIPIDIFLCHLRQKSLSFKNNCDILYKRVQFRAFFYADPSRFCGYFMTVKVFISKFVELFRDVTRKSDGWRAAARYLDTDYQKLQYRVRQAEKLDSLVSWLEPMRVKLKLSKTAAWDLLTGSKKKVD